MLSKKPVIHCDVLVVHCMDHRLQKFLQPWITVRFGYDTFDIISLAGGVHGYEMVLKYVQLAVQIHSIETVCLINHENCRAYGRDGTYKRHKQDLSNTREKVRALFPQLTVETFYRIWMGTLNRLNKESGSIRFLATTPSLLENLCNIPAAVQAATPRSDT